MTNSTVSAMCRAKVFGIWLFGAIIVITLIALSSANSRRTARFEAARDLVQAEDNTPKALTLIDQYRLTDVDLRKLPKDVHYYELSILIFGIPVDTGCTDIIKDYKIGLVKDAKEKLAKHLEEVRANAKKLNITPAEVTNARNVIRAEAKAKAKAKTEEDAEREQKINREVAKEFNLTEDEVVEAKKRFTSITVTDWSWIYEDDSCYIAGTATNNTDQTLSYAEVEFNLYDTGGAQIDTAMDNINNLEPHGTWKFKAVVIDEKAHSAKLTSTEAW